MWCEKTFFTLVIWCYLGIAGRKWKRDKDDEKKLLQKSLKANLKKLKTFCAGERTISKETSKFPCSVCRRRVGSNSVLCIKCNSRVNKKCT